MSGRQAHGRLDEIAIRYPKGTIPMSTAVYRGTVKDGTVVLENDVRLRDGVKVLVTPERAKAGTASALLDALEAAPPVPAEWVDELEQLIAEGR